MDKEIGRGNSPQSLDKSHISPCLSKLSSSSRAIPTDKDFHFFYNFDEFKVPIQEINALSQSMLEAIGSSAAICDNPVGLPDEIDYDDTYDWLVNVNDELYERFDVSIDDFERNRNKEEEIGRALAPGADSESGFQLVCRKKKKGLASEGPSLKEEENAVSVKVMVKAKAKVPFHVPTIKKPQEEYKISPDNSNKHFVHVCLERSEDGQRFIHPLEKYSVLDFVDTDTGDVAPAEPRAIEDTPFKLVEEVNDLEELAAKLCSVNEFSVDLEHNQYRSFQGLTCLMQISTRNEDFVVDTLKLRMHVGPCLREVFMDPSKKKVMHGADRDIVWLQRDFGIYVCNMFDTGQASRVLKLERNSLEFLLHQFCGVTANKEYQNADWRVRPIPDVMLRYAREDTHFLLYIFDVMKVKLKSMSLESESSISPLVEVANRSAVLDCLGLLDSIEFELSSSRLYLPSHQPKVYQRSYDVCMQLYEKELWTEDSYMHIYGLQGAGFDAQQIAIVAGLCEWRDSIARAEDESTGFILPNKALIEIAKQIPVTMTQLRQLARSKYPSVERRINSVLNIIRHSMQNASAFEEASKQLKEAQQQKEAQQAERTRIAIDASPQRCDGSLVEPSITTPDIGMDIVNSVTDLAQSTSPNEAKSAKLEVSFLKLGMEDFKNQGGSCFPESSKDMPSRSESSLSEKGSASTVQVSKKNSSGFAALLGKTAPKKKFNVDNTEKEATKLKEIRSSVNLSFQPFSGKDLTPKPVVESPKVSVIAQAAQPCLIPASNSKLDDIILLDDDESSVEILENGYSEVVDDASIVSGSALRIKEEDGPGKQKNIEGAEKPNVEVQIKPFDYEAAIRFGENKGGRPGGAQKNNNKRRESGGSKGKKRSNETSEFSQGRRRQAFPSSGNRTSTFLPM